jgi:hypothetical protein
MMCSAENLEVAMLREVFASLHIFIHLSPTLFAERVLCLSVLRQVCSLFHGEFSRDWEPMFAISSPSIFSFT